MLFQSHVMITNCTGGSLSFAATIFRILRELANLVPKISKHGARSPHVHVSMGLTDYDYGFVSGVEAPCISSAVRGDGKWRAGMSHSRVNQTCQWILSSGFAYVLVTEG